MFTRRLSAYIATLVFTLGMVSPLGAACDKGSAIEAQSGAGAHFQHQEHPDRSQHSSHDKAPCTPDDGNCCAAMASCATLSFTGDVAAVGIPRPFAQRVRLVTVFPPATPPLSVEPPPPRA